jgi:hypothetical protein
MASLYHFNKFFIILTFNKIFLILKVLVPSSSNSLKYERIEMFYHRKPDENTMFFQIETETGKQLSLTRIYFFNKKNDFNF